MNRCTKPNLTCTTATTMQNKIQSTTKLSGYTSRKENDQTHEVNNIHLEYRPYTFSAASTFLTPKCASVSSSIALAVRSSILSLPASLDRSGTKPPKVFKVELRVVASYSGSADASLWRSRTSESVAIGRVQESPWKRGRCQIVPEECCRKRVYPVGAISKRWWLHLLGLVLWN